MSLRVVRMLVVMQVLALPVSTRSDAQAGGGVAATPLPPPGAAGQAVRKPAPPLPAQRPQPPHSPSVLGNPPVVRPPHAPARKPGPKAGDHARKPSTAATKSGAPAKPPATAPQAAPPPVATPPPKADPTKGGNSGLKLPRWASFRSDEVNLRSGPGMRYPIDWVYHRRDLPVQIVREFEVWRLVRLQDDTKGWVHSATLTGRRGFVVQGGEQALRSAADDVAEPVAKLQPGVVGHVRSCAAGTDWCQVQTGEYRGWLRRAAIFGVSPDEAIE